jgi:hypothetical protein
METFFLKSLPKIANLGAYSTPPQIAYFYNLFTEASSEFRFLRKLHPFAQIAGYPFYTDIPAFYLPAGTHAQGDEV